MSDLPNVSIWTDGACQPNPGWAAIGVVLVSGSNRKEISAAIGKSTNQRAEIMAVIAALEALKQPCRAIVNTDSKYVINCATGEWNRKVHQDLWKRYDEAAQPHTVEFFWVKSHNGKLNNERANTLAQEAVSLNQKTG